VNKSWNAINLEEKTILIMQYPKEPSLFINRRWGPWIFHAGKQITGMK
jgi:hypothetical protein